MALSSNGPLNRLLARRKRWAKQQANGLRLIDQSLESRIPGMEVERPAPAYTVPVHKPGTPIPDRSIATPSEDPEFRSELGGVERGHAQPMPYPLLHTTFQPEGTLAPYAPQNVMDRGFDDPRVTDAVPDEVLMDLPSMNAEREAQVEMEGTSRFKWEPNEHIGPRWIAGMGNHNGNGLGLTPGFDVKASIARITAERAAREQEAARREQEAVQLKQQIESQKLALEQSTAALAAREEAGALPARVSAKRFPIVPVAVAGGLALLGLILILTKKKRS